MTGETQWIMVDVETSGPNYGAHSLLEIGAVVGSRSKGIEDSFAALLRPTSDVVEQSRATFARAQTAGEDPAQAMRRFAEWAKPYIDRGARFIARPAAFDWPWIVYYAWRFLGENPFGFKAVCASSWFDARGKRFRVSLPHVAVDDARIQLEHFFTYG
ncbi:MAG: exonuclease domain-containing protein [Polyangiales bacterium]